LLFAGGLAFAAETAPETGLDPPRAVSRAKPQYPRAAAARGIEGVVKLEFTVDGEGNVVAPRVITADPPGVFDAAALEALSKWKYEPRGTDTAGMKVNIAFKQE
jgi:protein TonB